MIPHRLRLLNFMCYREEQSLDFSGIHLACLAGDNGHGKSALLDAMTWALWGKARSDRDDELISLGEIEMWVELEFDLAGQRYRVWRQRSRKGRGQSELHFYIWKSGAQTSDAGESDTGDWQLLDDGGLRERQAQIIRTLRMEYETFVNSAFLLQGRADSFTVKTPSERKQILADILGLSRYDLYEARARDEAQARKDQAARLTGEIAGMDAELGRRVEYNARLQAARAAATTAATAVRAAEADLTQARLAIQERQAQARQLADLRVRLARAERDLADGRAQLSAAAARAAQFEGVLEQRSEIEAGWAELQRARAEDAAWNARLLRHTQAGEQLNRARLAVDQARLAMEAEHRRLDDRQAELARKIAAGHEQAAVLAEAQAILARLAEQQARRDAIASELREIAGQAMALRHELERLKAEGQAVKDKVEMMAAAETAACPLCGQLLDAEHRDRMQADFAVEREELAGRYRADQAALKALDKRRSGLESEDADLARELRARDARQRQAAQAETAVADGQAAADEHARVAGQIAELATRLASGDYARAERTALTQMEAVLAEIGYDEAGHAASRARIQELESFDARYGRQLLPALDGIAEAQARSVALAEQQARREEELAVDRAEAERLTAAVVDMAALEAAVKRAEADVERAAQTERRVRLEEGAAAQQISALAALEDRRATRLAELDRVNAEISIYIQLREAFGKKGLQAMIIESAIPEVENEANRLLARMSEGRMNLRLETQREKVTGGVAETLDIIVSDELGARAYEMFSGGESFRVNLALRIAISKLLARRAGAQLQTLVIDEGFGSQDSQGRSLVVETINSIQSDFERVIVITHIEELKDLFPARIDVVKTANGSRVSIA